MNARKTDPKQGRLVALVLLALILGVMGFVAWVAVSNKGGTAGPHAIVDAGGVPSAKPREASHEAATAAAPPWGSRPLEVTVADRAARDELRRRILAAWAASADETVAAAAREGRFVPIPEERDASASYIRQVFRDDFVPMARKCYDELLARKKGAGGTLMIKFKLVGDEKIGGIIEEVDVETEGGLADERLLTCMRESFLSLGFRPPPSRWMTVHYPLTLTADDESDH